MKRRVVFIVQGEGRGHLTQAIAMAELLRESSYEVVACMIGRAHDMDIPAVIDGEIDCPLIPFRSPNLIYSKRTGALNIKRTVTNAIMHFGRYFNNINRIQDIVIAYRADVIINFYDVLGGLYNLFINQNRIPFVAVAHQYYMMHRDFVHPSGQPISRWLLQLNSRITSAKAIRRLGLSFSPESSDGRRRITVVPPLLRRSAIASDQPSVDEGFILAYCTQESMERELVRLGQELQRPIHCYSNRIATREQEYVADGIHFHQVNGQRFLDHMRRCSMIVSTAGFESVCEAFYRGKPALLMPLPNHYEQLCNAIDAERVGAGQRLAIYGSTMQDVQYDESSVAFKSWIAEAREHFLIALDSAIDRPPKRVIYRSTDVLLKYSVWPLRRGLDLIY